MIVEKSQFVESVKDVFFEEMGSIGENSKVDRDVCVDADWLGVVGGCEICLIQAIKGGGETEVVINNLHRLQQNG